MKKGSKEKNNIFPGVFMVVALALLLTTNPSFAGQKVYFYHTDAAGTPVAMTDASGTVVWRADYKPFGEEQSITGTVANNEKFVGKEKDQETGLYYFGARYMDAKTGRFVSVDPKGVTEKDLLNPQRLNRYNYSLNNPYRYIDPDGREVRLIARRLNVPIVGRLGIHTFIEIKPDNPKDFNGMKRWVIGGYEEGGRLTSKKNAEVDLKWTGDQKGNYLIPTPDGKTDTQFINDITESFNKYESGSRKWEASPELNENEGNCNTISTGALVGAGVSNESIKKLDPAGINWGLGTSLPEMLRKD
jgi:RHS repeat-associated protein